MYNKYFSPQVKYVSYPINQSTVSRRYSGILSSLTNFWSPFVENVQFISVEASPSHGERCSHCIHQHPVSADGAHHYTPHLQYQQHPRVRYELSRLFHRNSCPDFLD